MLTLTPEAERVVFDVVVREDAGPDAGLRISPGPPSAAEGTWNYAVVHGPWEGDLVIEDGNARVFVDADAASELEDSVLDAHIDEQTLEARFIVRVRDTG
jgi:iron-sulfur cluster assembly protein